MAKIFNKVADATADLGFPLFCGNAPAPEFASVLDLTKAKETPNGVVFYIDAASTGTATLEFASSANDVKAGNWFTDPNNATLTIPSGKSVHPINNGAKYIRVIPTGTGQTCIVGQYTASILVGGGGASATTLSSAFDTSFLPMVDPVANVQYFGKWEVAADNSTSTLVYYDMAGAVATPANPPVFLSDSDATAETTKLVAINAGAGYNVGDSITRTRFYDTTTNQTTGIVYFNEVSGTAIAAPVPADYEVFVENQRPTAQYNATDPTIADTEFLELQATEKGHLKVNVENSTPVAEYNATPIVLTDLDEDALQLRVDGNLKTAVENFTEQLEYNAVEPTIADGGTDKLQGTTEGHLKVAVQNNQPVAEFTAGAIALTDGDADALQLRTTGELKTVNENFDEQAEHNATLPTVADGGQTRLQVDSNGRLITAPELQASRDLGVTTEHIPLTADGTKVKVEADIIIEDETVGKYNATLPTLTDGDETYLQTDVNGRLITQEVAEYNTTAPTLTDGARTAPQTDVNGNLKIASQQIATANTDFEVFDNQTAAFTTTLATFRQAEIRLLNTEQGSTGRGFTVAWGAFTKTIDWSQYGQAGYGFPELPNSYYDFTVTVTPTGGAVLDATFIK